jgi:hypothetical protein
VPGPQSFLPHKVDIDKDYEENQRGAWDRELGVCAYIFSFFIIFFVIQLYNIFYIVLDVHCDIYKSSYNIT